MAELGVDTIAPIVRHGVILDIAGLEGKDALPEDFEVRPAHLSQASKVEVRPDDVVMIRTGWGQFSVTPSGTSTTRLLRDRESKERAG